jgi:methionyl aminopeptidase
MSRVRALARRVLGRASNSSKSYEVIRAPSLPLSPLRLVPAHVVRPPYARVPATPPTDTEQGSVPILTQNEIACLKRACTITKLALDSVATLIKPGVSTDELDAHVHEFIISHNAYPSPLGYLGFPKSICTSANNIVCHGIPDQRVLKEGDIINVDATSYIDGFHGDSSRSFLVGSVDEAGQKLVATASECLEKAVAICRPGVPYSQIGKIIYEHALGQGFEVCREFIGHGIGRAFHCPPQIFHFPVNLPGVMVANTAFTIEPCINEHKRHMFVWESDGWTAATADHGRSAQFEHTILITENVSAEGVILGVFSLSGKAKK